MINRPQCRPSPYVYLAQWGRAKQSSPSSSQPYDSSPRTVLPTHISRPWRVAMSESERLVSCLGLQNAPSNQWSRLDKILDALHLLAERLSTSKETPEVDPRQHFYQVFNREADEYDKDFHHKYHDDLNTTLIFVCPLRNKPYSRIDGSPGWSVLCCGFRVHRGYPKRTPT